MYIHFGFPIWGVPRLEYLHKRAQFQQIKRQTNQANLFYRNYPMYIHSVIYSDGGYDMRYKDVAPYLLSGMVSIIGINKIVSTEYVPAPVLLHMPDAVPVPDAVLHVDSSVVSAAESRYDVIYTRANGNQFRRSGGTRAWRNNNPGCLRYSDFTVSMGAIGFAGGFAVFPDEHTGMRAIHALLKSDAYKNLTISQAIFKYAPPHENDTENYKAILRKMTGLDTSKKLSELADNQLTHVVNVIRVVEGWVPGTETYVQPQKSSVLPRDTIDYVAVAWIHNRSR